MKKHTLALLVVLLAATSVAQAGSKLSMNVVPTPPDCSIAAGPACLNSGASCSDIGGNTDCVLQGVSPKSTISLTGKLSLKGSFREVRDNGGLLVNTGLVGAVDNYVVEVGLQTCTVDNTEIPYCSANQNVYVKLALLKGKGSFKVDLSPLFLSFGTGTALRINHVALITPRPSACAGANSATDLAARLNDETNCNDGIGILGVGGIAVLQ